MIVQIVGPDVISQAVHVQVSNAVMRVQVEVIPHISSSRVMQPQV